MVCRMNMGGLLGIFFWFLFLKLSTADSEFSDLEFKALVKQNVQLSTKLQTLQNDVKRRDDLLTELLERLIRQEKRMDELENVVKFKDNFCKQCESRLKDVETKSSAVSNEAIIRTNTNSSNRTPVIKDDKKISRKERLLASIIPRNAPSFDGIVAFYAQMSVIENSPSAHHTLIFDKVRTNVGNGYNGVTGIFTSPKEGIYVLNWVIRMYSAEHSTELMLNNDQLGATFLRAKQGDDGSVSGLAVAHLAKGDVVFVRVNSLYAGDGNVHADRNGWPSFSGWLLH